MNVEFFKQCHPTRQGYWARIKDHKVKSIYYLILLATCSLSFWCAIRCPPFLCCGKLPFPACLCTALPLCGFSAAGGFRGLFLMVDGRQRSLAPKHSAVLLLVDIVGTWFTFNLKFGSLLVWGYEFLNGSIIYSL